MLSMRRQSLLLSNILHFVALESQNLSPNWQKNDIMVSLGLSSHPWARLSYLVKPEKA